MVVEQRVFVDFAKDVTAGDVVADGKRRRKVPLDRPREGLGVDAA